jgi:hypothetical protein
VKALGGLANRADPRHFVQVVQKAQMIQEQAHRW